MRPCQGKHGVGGGTDGMVRGAQSWKLEKVANCQIPDTHRSYAQCLFEKSRAAKLETHKSAEHKAPEKPNLDI